MSRQIDRKCPYLDQESHSPLSTIVTENPPTPIIIKLTDNKTNFKEMKIAERNALMSALKNALRNHEVRDSYTARGGDLFVVPTDLTQQKAILDLDQA